MIFTQNNVSNKVVSLIITSNTIVSMLLLSRMSSSMLGVCLSRVLGITDSLLPERSSRVSLELMRCQDKNMEIIFLNLITISSPCEGLFEHIWEPGEAIGGQGEADEAGGEAVEAEVTASVQMIVIQIKRGEPDTEHGH